MYGCSSLQKIPGEDTGQVIIPNVETYTLGSSITEDYAVQSENVFKRYPGA